MCVCTHSPGRLGGIPPHCPRLPCLAGTFLLKLAIIFFHVSSLFLSLPEREQAVVWKPSNCLWACRFFPPSTCPHLILWPPLEAQLLGAPMWHSLQGWQLAWLLSAAHLPPTFPSKALCWLLSHHCPMDSSQYPSAPPEKLLLFPFCRQGNEVSMGGMAFPELPSQLVAVLGFQLLPNSRTFLNCCSLPSRLHERINE